MVSCLLSLSLAALLLSRASAQVLILAEGKFETSTNVSSWADLALDVAEMRETDDLDLKRSIYLNGKNAKYESSDNQVQTRSLASLSRNAYDTLKADAMFSFFRHAFLELGADIEGEQLGEFDNRPVAEYADTLVLDLFALNITNIESEAALILNVWMYVVHELYDVLRACKRNDLQSVADMNAALDIAAALWIGTGQLQGDNDSGNMLYNLAEVAGVRFDQDRGETVANTLVIDALNALKLGINFGTCSNDANGYIEFRTIVRQTIGHMTIPLLQILIHHLMQEPSVERSNFIELYALSVAPRVEACNPTAYGDMLSMFVRSNFEANERNVALALLQSVYTCLEVTCSEVGTYRSGVDDTCTDAPQGLPIFAGYPTSFGNVLPYANFDRDLFQIKILTKARAYEAALDYYQYGYNVKIGEVFLTLQDLAVSPARSVAASQLGLFSTFYEGDNYADGIVQNILALESPYDNMPADQTTELVFGTLQYMVMYMAILEKVYGAADKCRVGGSDATDEAAFLLDQGVAFYVGSIEGATAAGRERGQLLFATSKQLCQFFDTCVEENNSEVNGSIIAAFRALSNQLTLGECGQADQTIALEIAPLLIVPFVQGTLYATAVLDGLQVGAQDAIVGTGHAFSRALLPLLDNVDVSNTFVIASNLNFRQPGAPIPDGAEAVFLAFQDIIPGMQVPDLPSKCTSIGVYQNAVYPNLCDGLNVGPTTPRPTPAPAVVVATPAPTPAPTFNTGGTPNPVAIATPSPVQQQQTPSPVGGNTASPIDASSSVGLGVYEFSNNIGPVAAIALDVRDMRAGSIQQSNFTYLNGKHSNVVGANGQSVTVSLALLSLTSADYMHQDPMYNLFRWALLNETIFSTEGIDTPASDSAYAHVVVTEALGVARNVELAAETTVIMHVWMEITHHLYDSIRECQKGDSKAVRSIDEAVALWIGEDQTRGSYSTGYLMYYIAQQAASKFGYPEGEAAANTKLLELFNLAKTTSQSCSTTPDVSSSLRLLVAEILSWMTVPLIQNLIYYVNQGNVNYAELYALATIPQAVGCGENRYESLRNVLVKENSTVTFDSLSSDFMDEFQAFQKCLRITCNDIRDRPIANAALDNAVSDLCFDDTAPDAYALVGYNSTAALDEFGRLDLDILHIGIMLETGADSAALDIYANGWNSLDGPVSRSLRSVALSDVRQAAPQFAKFQAYFNSIDYADDFITDAIDASGIFVEASRDQRAEIATRSLQCMVSFMLVLEKVYTALGMCEATSNGAREWGEAMAVFVGSIQGSDRGGAEGDGTSLYALGRDLCGSFNTCEASGEASINEDLMEAFSDGKELIEDGDCSGAEDIVNNEIIQSLPVPLIQGTLFFASVNDELDVGINDFEIAAGYILASSILPLVNDANATSASTIKRNMGFDRNQLPVPDGPGAVFEAITFALPGMKVDCRDVGSYDGNRAVCSAPVVRPHPKTPTNLGDGLYITTTDVKDRADIAKDIVDIKAALESGSSQLAQLIYRDGQHSKVFNENGNEVGVRSLAGFSTTATLQMMDEPVFNIFRFALRGEDGLFLGNEDRLYADSVVNDAFQLTTPAARTVAVEAMIAINLWMYLVHELFQTLKNCKNGVIADTDGIHSIDEAVAYWIGDGQIAGDSERGHLLYALAEEMGENFQNEVGGQARSNKNILRLFNEAKNVVGLPNACRGDPETYPRLRMIINNIVSQMTIPLVQGLIHNLRNNDRDRVKMYAHAFVPLVVACNPSLYAFLREKLMLLTYNVVEVEDIVERIRTTYDCLRITCDDVGQHTTETSSVCVDTPRLNAIAGYRPSNDVRQYAFLDLDILEASILMDMKAYSAVEELYTYGKHAVFKGVNGEEALTLSRLATTSARTLVPQYDSFVRYFNDDNKYADTIIRTALAPSQLTAASDQQRREIVVRSMQCLVLYMAVLEQMYTAVEDCDSTDQLRVLDAGSGWDRAAALLIGSIEGAEQGGTSDGHSLFGLSKSLCAQFGTCGSSGSSTTNEEMISLLYTGKGAVDGASCGALRRTVNEMRPLLLVPLIQANLASALVNEKHPKGIQVPEFAQGYAYSRSVLPLVDDVNRESSAAINKNLDFQFNTEPVPDGASAVFRAFAQVYAGLNVDCRMLGSIEGRDPCDGSGGGASGTNIGLIVGVSLAVIAALTVGVCFFVRRNRMKRNHETSPLFVKSNGVLNHNHDSDLLSGKLNDADVIDSDEAFDKRIRKQVGELDGFTIT